ncbi:MAG: YbjN domain-containing protein [Caulobacterales bacterium]|uniref:YbjN domain-containing protein n=1 Tax=Glycocaulis sp. TaxID=1969725 RepID=UPI003F9ED1B9
MKTIAFFVSAALIVLCSGPGAFARQEVIERIDGPGLRTLVTGLGHEITQDAVTDEGQPFLTARAGTLNYMVAGTACTEGQCQGMLTELLFTGTEATAETANAINESYAAIKMTVLENGNVVVSRYDVINGGTTAGALATSITTLLEITARLISEPAAEE